MIYYRIFRKIYELLIEKMCQAYPFSIEKDARILDLGCGSGIVAKKVHDLSGAEVIGIDIIDQRVVDIPFQLYDGLHIPFDDNSFDAVLISFVLHHCNDSELTLREAKRVSKGKIAIYEDLPVGKFSKLICGLHGFAYARFFQKNKEYGIFKTNQEWKGTFRKLNLKLIFEKKVLSIFMTRKLFVLEKIRGT